MKRRAIAVISLLVGIVMVIVLAVGMSLVFSAISSPRQTGQEEQEPSDQSPTATIVPLPTEREIPPFRAENIRVVGTVQITPDNNDGLRTWSPDSTRILFRKPTDKIIPISPVEAEVIVDTWVAYADGSPSKLLASNAGRADWAPDGKHVIYRSFVDGDHYDIYIITSEGTNAVKLATGDYAPIQFLSDGTIAYVRSGRLTVMDSNGMTLREISTPIPLASSATIEFSFSPDGKHVAFKVDGRLWVASTDGTSATLLTDKYRSNSMRWSPDSRNLAYSTEEIWVVAADGTNPVKVASLQNSRLGSPSWSPDSQVIAFVRAAGGNIGQPTTYVVNADGSNMTMLVSDSAGTFSPDGTKMLLIGRDRPFSVAFLSH